MDNGNDQDGAQENLVKTNLLDLKNNSLRQKFEGIFAPEEELNQPNLLKEGVEIIEP